MYQEFLLLLVQPKNHFFNIHVHMIYNKKEKGRGCSLAQILRFYHTAGHHNSKTIVKHIIKMIFMRDPFVIVEQKLYCLGSVRMTLS